MIQPLNLGSESTAPRKSIPVKPIAGLVVIIIAGILSGYGLFSLQSAAGPKKLKTSIEGGVKPGDSFGVEDTQVFTDSAEGELANGGIGGEGSHHLIREGGESQYVYLTSSILDLDQFVGKTVKIWGQTFDAQKAGWLMDVGRLEVK